MSLDHIAWIDDDGEHTTFDLLDAGVPLPDVLPGDVVAIRCTSARDTWSTMLAVWAKDAVAFPIGAREPPARVRQLLNDAGAAFLVRDNVVATDVPVRARVPGASTVIATSGTTGDPKCIVHTVDAHAEAASAHAQALQLGPDDRWLLSLPMHHVGGFCIARRMHTVGGAVADPGDLRNLAGALIRHRPTHASLVPTQLRRLLHDDEATKALALCRGVLLGGGPAPASLRRQALDAGIPLIATYGMTETLAFIAASNEPTVVEQEDTAGRVLEGRRVTSAEDGTLHIESPTLFAGTLKGGVYTERPAGSFATRDIGHLDADGVLHILGRKDRCFVSGGENVHPEEIERALCAQPTVEAAIVIPTPDATYGMRPIAFVRCSDSGAVLEGRLRESLPGFKVPDAWYVLPAQATVAQLEALARDPDALEQLG